MEDKIINFDKLETFDKNELIDHLRGVARHLCGLSLEKVLESNDDYIFHTFNGAIYAFYQMDLISEAQMAVIFGIIAEKRPDIDEMIKKLYEKDFSPKEELLN